MLKFHNILILLSIFTIPLGACSQSQSKHDKFHPYLEDLRELQIPQWENKNWYAEDWAAQKSETDLMKAFYKADILRDQVKEKDAMPVLIVGPNFYRLSGYDKRRVATVVNMVYGITEQKQDGAFYLKDWKTKKKIGIFNADGLRLH